MLDDQDAVPLGFQVAEADEQAVGVAGVQAGGRLVEHVADPDKPRAELSGQPDPLQLAPGERPRAPAERQVAEADVRQETQPPLDLLENRQGHGLIGFGESEGLEEAGRVVDRHVEDPIDRQPLDPHVPGFGPEPRALAVGAGGLVVVAFLARLVRDDA